MDAEWKLVVSLLVCFVSSHITLSILTAVGLGGRGLSSTRMSPFWILSELRVPEVVSGDNWSYNACKALDKSSPPTYQYLAFYRPDSLPEAQPTVSEQFTSQQQNENFHRHGPYKVCWSMFNGNFSRNRLNHAMVVSSVSLTGRGRTGNTQNTCTHKTLFNLVFVEIISSTLVLEFSSEESLQPIT